MPSDNNRQRVVEELKAASASKIAALVRTQISAGINLCKMAKKSTYYENCEALLHLARQARDTAERWIWTYHIRMNYRDFDQITIDLDRLHHELNFHCDASPLHC
jgi:hypothetical protein